jgi:hypothetical protein
VPRARGFRRPGAPVNATTYGRPRASPSTASVAAYPPNRCRPPQQDDQHNSQQYPPATRPRARTRRADLCQRRESSLLLQRAENAGPRQAASLVM